MKDFNDKDKEQFHYHPIGEILTPHKSPKGTPIQPAAAEGVEGEVKVFPEYVEGLEDLEGFSHVTLIYHFHLAGEARMKVEPFLEESQHGLFATRSPARPNPIGLSTVKLQKIENGTLYVENIDVLNGTPLLDLKPHVKRFDQPEILSEGWLTENVQNLEDSTDDGRFAR